MVQNAGKKNVVAPEGLEPPTCKVRTCCSIHLSYGAANLAVFRSRLKL